MNFEAVLRESLREHVQDPASIDLMRAYDDEVVGVPDQER
jgi:hypothetical protein